MLGFLEMTCGSFLDDLAWSSKKYEEKQKGKLISNTLQIGGI